jgi:hypothetical protein
MTQKENEWDNELLRLLKSAGEIAGTDEEVEITEKLLSQRAPVVPASMADASKLFARITASRNISRLNAAQPTPSEEGLARAAREGKPISLTVEDLMRKDRREAEKGHE